MKLSIAIPTYEFHGFGVEFLRVSLDRLKSQSFTDFEVIISDQSQDSLIKDLCDTYSQDLDIKYIPNIHDRGRQSGNLNNSILHCRGDIIKILFQDDFLWDNASLEKTVESFTQETMWMFSCCCMSNYRELPFYQQVMRPRYNDKIYLGNNTIGPPSVLSIRNRDKIFFDEKLTWLMDVDYYKSCYNKFGYPTILYRITVVNRIHAFSATSLMPQNIKDQELHMMIGRYGW